MVLIDTNILIEIFKGNSKYFNEIKKIGMEDLCISKISVFEMFVGALNKKELEKIRKFLTKFSQLSINENITDYTVELLHSYRLSHGLFINDAIIAATCLEYKLPLYTLNTKDFKFIPFLNFYKL